MDFGKDEYASLVWLSRNLKIVSRTLPGQKEKFMCKPYFYIVVKFLRNFYYCTL